MIPDFQMIMLPLLESLKSNEARTMEQTHDALARYFELTDEELSERSQGDNQTVFYKNMNVAQSHLQRADLITNASAWLIKITPLGKQVLHRRLNGIDTNYLKRFPGYVEK
jgi:restriction system protein